MIVLMVTLCVANLYLHYYEIEVKHNSDKRFYYLSSIEIVGKALLAYPLAAVCGVLAILVSNSDLFDY